MRTISIPGLSFGKSAFVRRIARENTLDVLNAEIWAREALLQLEGNLVLGNIAYKDFSPQVARFGDFVNVARPGTFTAKRKGALCEEIVIQDATADSFQVPLDQFLYVSFKICDGEEDRRMQDLVNLLLAPAIRALGAKMDLILAGQHVHFWDNSAGHLGGVSDTTIADYLIETKQVMDLNNAPDNRRMSITSATEAAMLKNGLFVEPGRVGTTAALRRGELGRLFGFNFYRPSNQPQVSAGQATSPALVDMALGAAAGTTVITVDTATNPVTGPPAGSFVVIAGDDIPHRVTATTVSAGAGNITISPPLKRAVANNAAVTSIKVGAVKKTGGYLGDAFTPTRRVGYAKGIITDGWTAGTIPQVGQPVTFGVTGTGAIYTIIEVGTTDDAGTALGANEYRIQLDRPLAADLADDALVCLGPSGSYNFAFTDNSLAAVFRPLPKPRTGTLSSVVNYRGFSLRVVISYNAMQQAHIVTVDTLMGVGVYDENTGAVMFG